MPGKSTRHSTLLALALCLVLVSGGGAAQDVGLAGVMGSRALLMIDGAEPQAVAIGQSLAGVKVVSVQGDQVVVEIGGKKRLLRVGQHAIGTAAADGSGRIVMTADNQGHFVTTGSVNGVAVRTEKSRALERLRRSSTLPGRLLRWKDVPSMVKEFST
jgi:aspartyl protease family protein